MILTVIVVSREVTRSYNTIMTKNANKACIEQTHKLIDTVVFDLLKYFLQTMETVTVLTNGTVTIYEYV